ncbi:PREDICTED: uncharacterized protein LOC103337863 [Prunus mume]|uniref:Uncharacterized protein LOC103337863 n=1 Tax=Prunus mume TaxID=102107 RepID=A0ABM0PGD7_PRUMU|nr:PREDICTED: uncharacterized protein LOC103337863 [Prunus mume]
MEGDVHGKRASSSVVQSRLSPAAQPFSLNTFSHQPSWSSLISADPCASMLKPVSDINLEDDPFSTAPYSFLEFVEDSHFLQYPSANAASDLGFMPSASKESLTNYTELSSFGYSQASFSSNKNASLAYETLLEQVALQNLMLTNDKGKGGKDGKPLSSEGIGALLKATSEPLITLTNIPDDFSLKHLGPKGAVSISKNLDENDSDLDSPCWKGTLASRQYGVSRSLSSDFVGNEQEVRNSLNPLAPQFFPRHAKAIVDYHANDYIGDDFSSFRKCESSAVNSSSKGHGPVDQAGSKSSSLIKGIGTQTSNDIHDLERVYPLLNNSESGSVLNLPEGLSKLSSTHSKLDVPTILNTMHDLSELLVQKCSNDLDSLNEHKHDLMQNIINNLCMYIQHGDGGEVPISDITLTGTPYCPVKSTELHKCSNTGFQVTRKKALAVPQEINYQNDREGCKVNSHVFTKRKLDSFPSCSGVGTEKSNDIVQVMGNALGDNHLTTEELDPQASVYKKLWLQAEAALCSMKYETCVLCMQLEMGGRKLDKNKVSGKLLTRDIH